MESPAKLSRAARLATAAVLAALWASMASVAPAAQIVRVDCSTGVPRLTIDGKPVRARMFYGSDPVQSAVKPIAITSTGRVETMEFVATQDVPASATLHFRFGQPASAAWAPIAPFGRRQ